MPKPLVTPGRLPVVPQPGSDAEMKSFLPKKYEDWKPGDFLWLEQEEPHKSRRMAIMKAHPEVTSLMGPTPLTFPLVLLVLTLQLSLAYYLRNTHPLSPIFLLTSYIIGGTTNQNLFLAVHEITHNLAFKGVGMNRFASVVANLGIGVPYAMVFKKYHMEHHRYLGEDEIDTDIPTRLEAALLSNVFGKTFFCTFQLFFYALRPSFVRTIPLTPISWVIFNITLQLLFDFLVYTYVSPIALLYLIMSSFFAGSLHPMAGHFIAEHYLWEKWGVETWSYYGKLNWFAWNVGYHNEHHDFPSVPWTRLPQLHEMAKEFYDPLPRHDSWSLVIWNFIFTGDVGLWSRAKRENHEKTKAAAAQKKELEKKKKQQQVTASTTTTPSSDHGIATAIATTTAFSRVGPEAGSVELKSKGDNSDSESSSESSLFANSEGTRNSKDGEDDDDDDELVGERDGGGKGQTAGGMWDE